MKVKYSPRVLLLIACLFTFAFHFCTSPIVSGYPLLGNFGYCTPFPSLPPLNLRLQFTLLASHSLYKSKSELCCTQHECNKTIECCLHPQARAISMSSFIFSKSKSLHTPQTTAPSLHLNLHVKHVLHRLETPRHRTEGNLYMRMGSLRHAFKHAA
jgi:hypothetical protein